MAKKKLIHFQENLTFPHLFQPSYRDFDPEFRLRSKWHDLFFDNDRPLAVELGCGKGEYTVGLASRYPDKNFIGIDWKGARLWRGCKTVSEQQLKNVAFVRTQVDHVERIFAHGEVNEIWITFPDPQVKKERLRLTAPIFLEKYRNILTPDGTIHLKTDDLFFYRYTMEVLQENKHKVIMFTDDLYHLAIQDDATAIQTFYENRWLEQGKKICYVKFQLSAP